MYNKQKNTLNEKNETKEEYQPSNGMLKLTSKNTSKKGAPIIALICIEVTKKDLVNAYAITRQLKGVIPKIGVNGHRLVF